MPLSVTVPAPETVTPPVPVMALLIVRAVLAVMMPSDVPKSSVPPVMVAVPPLDGHEAAAGHGQGEIVAADAGGESERCPAAARN